MMKRLLITGILGLFAYSLSAQYFNSVSSNYWKRYRKEFIVQLGSSHFLGELGGRDQVGSDFIWDLETQMTKPSGSIGYRYYIMKSVAIHGAIAGGLVSGDDQLTKEQFRRNRNLHFRSWLVEAAIRAEYHLSLGELGNLYGIGSRKSRLKSSFKDIYGFIGFGGFYFNPQAKYEGEWVNLKPLSTEGQGMEGGPDEYSLFQPCVPMGLGFRIGLGKKYRLGIEMGYRKTFTDYIDDVSTDYYPNEKLREEKGQRAADLANPSLGTVEETHNYDPTRAGMQRGDPEDNDAYIFLNLTFSWKIGMDTRYMNRFNRSILRRKTRAKF